ncbi:GTPase Era isoform 2 [Schistosoma japonicum]|uniref:GTPase Era, mitochondrial n=2 Tax=Schistosoma japonicum TaxID=6182 RepID=A0A4Z2DHX5_SCHJA|nr:GTPase Era isoform 2 [Schistosoma japonicum]
MPLNGQCVYLFANVCRKFCGSPRLICNQLYTGVLANEIICPPRVQSVPHTKREYLEKLLLQQPHSPPDARVLKIAVIGCPNSGKSSLVNMLTKWKVCAVSGKAHTTRSKQTAAFFQDNVQLAFVDLPGLVSKSKASRFKLEKTFIRDPHSAIFDSDLILVVIDVSHKESCEVLHEEIVKALHFFSDKESILVLNKIDRFVKNPTRLLDITRKLTGGIVHGQRSHVDRYADRFKRQAKLSDTAHHLIPPNELIAARLPDACHETANRFLVYMNSLLAKIESTHVDINETNPKYLLGNVLQEKPLSDAFMKDRFLTEVEKENINAFFDEYTPSRNSELIPSDKQELRVSVSETNHLLLNKSDESNRIPHLNSSSDDIDSMLETLKQQLLLQIASPEEVSDRRKRWLEITKATKGVTKWLNFSEVFMVSSFMGDGIDKLRDFLISKAVPNRSWILPPTMVTDQEPTELIRMCVWSQCLNKLHKEIPYSLHIIVDDCDKIKLDHGDDRIYVHVRIQCHSERQLVSSCQQCIINYILNCRSLL